MKEPKYKPVVTTYSRGEARYARAVLKREGRDVRVFHKGRGSAYQVRARR